MKALYTQLPWFKGSQTVHPQKPTTNSLAGGFPWAARRRGEQHPNVMTQQALQVTPLTPTAPPL